jgi:hypothetical protein
MTDLEKRIAARDENAAAFADLTTITEQVPPAYLPRFADVSRRLRLCFRVRSGQPVGGYDYNYRQVVLREATQILAEIQKERNQ